MKTFKEWNEKAEAKETVGFGYMSRNCRDIYDMLGMTIFIEMIMPRNVFKSMVIHVMAVDFNITTDDPIMDLAHKHGAGWMEGFYAEPGYGWPVWSGEDDRAEECWNFIQEYQQQKQAKERLEGLSQ